jgi:hypothetical protein
MVQEVVVTDFRSAGEFSRAVAIAPPGLFDIAALFPSADALG